MTGKAGRVEKTDTRSTADVEKVRKRRLGTRPGQSIQQDAGRDDRSRRIRKIAWEYHQDDCREAIGGVTPQGGRAIRLEQTA